MKTNTLINGKPAESISALDRGFQYGDGLFETVLVESGCATFLNAHLERLQRGCDALGFPRLEREQITNDVMRVINENQYGVVKIILTRGVGERGFLPPETPNITRLVSFSIRGESIKAPLTDIELVLCQTPLSQQPLLAGIKHLNQLERILARTELRENTSAEGLMLDTAGNVIEGTMSNVFIVKNDVLMTPKLNNCGVAGVIREHLLKEAKKAGFQCKEAVLTLKDIKEADEIFMTNSLMPVRRVSQFKADNELFDKSASSYASWALDSVLESIQQQVKEQ